jgi:hypothetical protein
MASNGRKADNETLPGVARIGEDRAEGSHYALFSAQ